MPESKKSLVAIPNTDAIKLSRLFERYSVDVAIDVIRHDELNLSHINEKSLGILLISPEQRLIRAYNAAQSANPTKYKSFSDFYTESNRVNFYSRLLNGYDISEFGFIGLQEHFYRGVLMLTDWLETRLGNLPYYASRTQFEFLSLSEEETREIRTLYAKDFELYNKAKKCFESRWNAYQQLHMLTPVPNKKIKIHLGPPKTGTSAIQAWLHENQKDLQYCHTLYPEHSSDQNGISSGNFEYLVSADPSSGRLYFDDEKAKQLINEFITSECNTLLLSSEHFYFYAMWLFSRFPDAQYIFYIRHPLAISESAFHQEVKRHGRFEPFVIPSSIGFNSLTLIQSIAKDFNCTLTYRYFDDSLFEGGSLLSDFGNAANIALVAPSKVKRLNTQYSPGAVKLMLTCNKFASEELRRDLDMALQKDSESISAFTFVTEEEYSVTQNKLKEEAQRLAKSEAKLNSHAITSLIESYKKPKTISDENALRDLHRVVDSLLKHEPKLSRRLYQELAQQMESDKDCTLLQHQLKTKWYIKLWCWWRGISK